MQLRKYENHLQIKKAEQLLTVPNEFGGA